MLRSLLLVSVLFVAACSPKYADLRPVLPNLDAALGRWEESLTKPSPAKTPEEAAELRKSDLSLCKQARDTIKVGLGR